MKECLFKKAMVIGIIILFVGASILPTISKTVSADDTTYTFYPTDDTEIAMGVPDYNMGSAINILIRNRYGAGGSDWWESDILIKFNLSSIPSGSTILSASLNMYYFWWKDNNPAGRDLNLYRITSGWDEDNVTWNTQPTYASHPTTNSSVPSSTGVWMDWEVTTDIQDFVDGEATNYGWKITDENYWGSYNIPIIGFRAKEYGSFIPYLNVIIENQPPVADAGPDQSVEQTSYEGAEVTLDGSGSYDPDGDPLAYEWTWTNGSSAGVSPTMTFSLGTTTVTLTVSDGTLTDLDTVNITVEDTTPPKITLSDEEIVLWPPNHKYHTFEISDFVISVSDICDADVDIDDIIITSVSSDEPENAQGGGDGNTWDDIIIVDYQTVKLRAERQGNGNGRVYTINFKVTDASNNTATESYKISVPHHHQGSTAIDDGPDAGYTVYYP